MDVIIKTVLAAHLSILVMKEWEIVMDLLMEVSMMEMLDAKEILSVEVTTASSLVLTTTPRMTAVKSLHLGSMGELTSLAVVIHNTDNIYIKVQYADYT